MSIFILLQKIQTSRSCAGISFKSQALYAGVFVLRYSDLLFSFYSLYNTVMKIFFIASSLYILYLMKVPFKPTNDPNIDTFRIEYLLGFSGILSFLFHYHLSLFEIVWSFSIWLEAVAILPQLMLLQRTGEAETITTHYLFALGIYRGLYILNWIYRYLSEGYFDPISLTAGIIQTGLYTDFFYIYYTRYE